MLRPGPGSHTEEVEQNQRERVFGAMIACVAERGYNATRVTDLVALSGVSSRTFYDLFADKETCFLETVQAVLALAAQAALAADAKAAKAEQSWEERAIGGFRVFAEMIASQPAAARVILIEAYAAGPAVLKPLDDAAAGFEWLAQQTSLDSPERVGTPAEMLTAHVGALQEIARNRLRTGTEAELPGLIEEVAKVMLSYRPPPVPLRLATRSPAARPEDLKAHSHAERALRAFAVVVAEKGYAQSTVDEIFARASMSASTFYANFSGKEDALMAAIDSAGAQVAAAVMPAFERSSDWPSGVRSAYGALFGFLATRPALAHLMSVGVYGAGLPAIRRRTKALAPLGALIEGGGSTGRLHPPRIVLEVIAGATYGLMYRQVRTGGPESLPALAPICTYLTLAPFIGAEEACAAANGDGRARPDPASLGEVGVAAAAVLRVIGEGVLTAQEISRQAEMEPEEVRERIAYLQNAGAVTIVDEKEEDGQLVRFYGSTLERIFEDDWTGIGLPERRRVSEQIGHLVRGEVEQAVKSGSFDRRSDRHLSRTPLLVDEQGWQELLAAHDVLLDTVLKIRGKSAERMGRSGERAIDARSVQTLFEMPQPD